MSIDKSSDILEAFCQSYRTIKTIWIDRWISKNITVFSSVFDTSQLKDLQIELCSINSESEEDDY